MDKYLTDAKWFIENLPYRSTPYNGRNWGHPWHSLCSYHGKLKPAIAHFLISTFTNKNDVMLDPLCGVGTIPFEACLQERVGIGNDMSEMAYIVSKAKLEKPSLNEVQTILSQLETYVNDNVHEMMNSSEALPYSNFGFNGKLPEYFERQTYSEILVGRKYFLDRLNSLSSAEAMVFSAFLHVLHGNRPYALSRTSHPLTPYKPKGEFQYKSVVKHITDKIQLSYKKGDFNTYVLGRAIWGDYSNLSSLLSSVDSIICSPPFADSIRFYMMNWMRLWLCGWETDDFKTADVKFIDKKQKKDFGVYSSFFEMCYNVLKPNGKVILHLGRTDKYDMAQELSIQAIPFFDEVYRGSENVSEIEKHGIKDKGSTTDHQFLFLRKK